MDDPRVAGQAATVVRRQGTPPLRLLLFRRLQAGNHSIWSLQVKNGAGETHRLVTIVVQSKSRRVTQVRGRHNLIPNVNSGGLRSFASVDEEQGWYLTRVREILQRWVRREHLGNKGADLNAWIAH